MCLKMLSFLSPFSSYPQEGSVWASTSDFGATSIFPRAGIRTRNSCTTVHGTLGVGGYNHHDNGEEGEWRPPLSYATPLGHHVPTTLFMRNGMNGDHYEMIGKVAFVVDLEVAARGAGV